MWYKAGITLNAYQASNDTWLVAHTRLVGSLLLPFIHLQFILVLIPGPGLYNCRPNIGLITHHACINPSKITNYRNSPIQFDMKSERGCCWGQRRAINQKAKPGSPQGLRKIKFSHMLWLLGYQECGFKKVQCTNW
jgi:hypothetical protein